MTDAQGETGPSILRSLQNGVQGPCLQLNGGLDIQSQQVASELATEAAADVATDSELHEGQPRVKRRKPQEEQQLQGSASPDAAPASAVRQPSPEPEPRPQEAGSSDSDGPAFMEEDEPAAREYKPRKELAIVYQNSKQGSKRNSKSRSRGTSRNSSSSYGSGSDAEASSGSTSPNEMSADEDVVLERHVSEEQYKKDEQTLKSMPELACICEFLFLFRKPLNLQTPVTFHSLLDALIVSPGPGMLQQLHIELLRVVVSTKFLDDRTWAHYLAHKLHAKWPMPWKQASNRGQGSGEDSDASVQPEKHHQLLAYAALSAKDRVLALKGLCDLRLERDDLRNLAHDSAVAASGGKDSSSASASSKPPVAGRTSRAAAAAAAAEEDTAVVPAELLRKQPIGVDGSGFTYYWLDWCEGHVEGGMDMGFMLAREAPATTPKTAPTAGPSKKASRKMEPRHRYQLPTLPVAGAWEAVAVSLDELEAFGAKLNRSLRKEDRTVAQHISGVVVAEIKSRLDEQERWRKARERTRKMLGLDVGLAVGGAGRSQRQRKAVNYGSEAFDKLMHKAIKAQGGKDDDDDDPAASKRKGKARGDSVECDAEPAGRRGRSRGSAQDLIALDMAAPRRPPRPKTKPQDEEQAGSIEPTNCEHVQMEEDQLPVQDQQVDAEVKAEQTQEQAAAGAVQNLAVASST